VLRVGLTGGLGSGKSTAARYFRELGAEVIEADELGRKLMEPGQAVFAEIVRVFGTEVVAADGRLNRARVAELAFQGGRLNELNAIVHPAVIAAQRAWMEQVFAANPHAVAMVESALIFEVERDARERGEEEGVLADWRRRFDRVIAVVAPSEVRIARYVARISPSGWDQKIAADARSRLARQISDEEKASRADYVIGNSGDLDDLRVQVEAAWRELQSQA
jgi:dephospho-CoA kinase